MEVGVLLFGPAAAAAGQDRLVVALGADRTCRAVVQALARAEPRLAPFVEAGRLAVNHEFAPPERVVGPGDEVALIALVSGG